MVRLKKKHSRILAFAIVFLAIFLAVVIGAKREIKSSLPSIELLRNKDGSVDASVVFGAFKKSEEKDGKKLWEITARVGKFHPTTGLAELQDSEVHLLKGEDTITMNSDTALITLKGSELEKVEATGNVVIHSAVRETTMYTDSLLYNKEDDTVFSKDFVRVVSPDMEISGTGLKGNTALKNFTLKENVSTTVQAKKSKSEQVKNEKK